MKKRKSLKKTLLGKAINPVTTVTERITDISKGDFTVKIVPEGNNEITTLSERLNEYIEKMRESIEKHFGEPEPVFG